MQIYLLFGVPSKASVDVKVQNQPIESKKFAVARC